MSKLFSSKYHAKESGEYEPGSNELVLKNLQGITSKEDIDQAEVKGYTKAFDFMINNFSSDQQLAISDIDEIHRVFFGNLYSWAGKHRSVNLTKDSFTFPAAQFLEQTLAQFENDILKPNTPCHGSRYETVRMIASVHLELLFIHPYREGNGRTARLIATLMAFQAGYSGFDWEILERKFNQYVRSIQKLDLELMCTLLDEGLLD